MDFWQELKNKGKPIYALAPMAGITDSPFRRMCKKFGADLLYSEMASAAALNYAPEKTLELLEFKQEERPYIVQLFGGEPEHFAKAAKIVTESIRPDGIDINFGCPVPKVVRQGAGVALFQDLQRSRKVIEAAIGSTDLPVSVKTRHKAGSTDVLEFLDNISDLGVKAVMIHGRTPAQGFSGDIDTLSIRKARNHFGGLILANGGVRDYGSATEILEESAADGLGIGQGALGRPWIFKALRTAQNTDRSPKAIAREAHEHALMVYKDKGEKGMVEMRKHLCWYVQGLPGAADLRRKLVGVDTFKDVSDVLSVLSSLEIQ